MLHLAFVLFTGIYGASLPSVDERYIVLYTSWCKAERGTTVNINELAERLAEHAAPHLTERAIRAQIKELYPRRKRFTGDDYQEAAAHLADSTRLDPSILEKTERPNRARRDLDDLYDKLVDARRATTDLQTTIRENTNARDRAISAAYDAGATQDELALATGISVMSVYNARRRGEKLRGVERRSFHRD